LKPFYEGWTTELTASVELAEPIYEGWACDVSSQWHKTQALTERQPSTKKKSLSFILWTPIGLWEYKYYVGELVERDDNINWMNECACKF
jgi:hypothetical protein